MRNQKDQGVVSSLIVFGILIMILLATCSGCSTVTPVKRNFPSVPADMLTSCPVLKEVDPKATKLSEVVLVVVDNYGAYQECAITTESWIDWYRTQKKIFEEVK